MVYEKLEIEVCYCIFTYSFKIFSFDESLSMTRNDLLIKKKKSMTRTDLYSVTNKLCHLVVAFYSYLVQNIFLWLWHWFELCSGDVYCSAWFIYTCFFLADMASQDCERFRIPPSFSAEGSYCAGSSMLGSYILQREVLKW